jgi:hypothetical protein
VRPDFSLVFLHLVTSNKSSQNVQLGFVIFGLL